MCTVLSFWVSDDFCKTLPSGSDKNEKYQILFYENHESKISIKKIIIIIKFYSDA